MTARVRGATTWAQFLCLGLTATPGVAWAQTAMPTQTTSQMTATSAAPVTPATAIPTRSVPEGVGSADRPRPEYAPVGIRAGGLFLYPRLTASVAYTDNLFAQDTGTDSDLVLELTPSMEVRSNWGRHALDASAYITPRIHADNSSENVTGFGASANGRLDVSSSTQATLSAGFARSHVLRTDIDSATAAAEPTPFDRVSVRAGIAHRLNRLTLRATAGYTNDDFKPVPRTGGGIVNENRRDVRIVTGGVEAFYALSPGYSLLVSAQLNDRNFRLAPGRPGFVPGVDLDRNSSGYAVQGGVRFELTRLLYGTVALGYLSQDFRNPGTPSISGLSASADLLWNITTLSSARLAIARDVEPSYEPTAPGRLSTNIDLSLEHELLRNLVLTVAAGRSIDKTEPLDLTDKGWRLQAGARYLIDNGLEARLGYTRESRTGAGPGRNFRENRLLLSVAYTL